MLLTYVLASRRRVLSSPSSVTYFAESSDLKKGEEAAILPKLFLSMGALNFYSELVPWTHDLFYSLSTIFAAWLLCVISFLEVQSPNYPPHSIWMIQFVAVTELEFCCFGPKQEKETALYHSIFATDIDHLHQVSHAA